MFDKTGASSWDMCSKPADWWGLDKPTVVAELPASSAHFSAGQMLECSSANGFAGNLFWAFNDPAFPLTPALPAIENFTHTRSDVTSYHALLAALDRLPVSSGSAAANEVAALESRASAAARSLSGSQLVTDLPAAAESAASESTRVRVLRPHGMAAAVLTASSTSR